MQHTIDSEVDCVDENCPMPLVKTREAIMHAKKGDIIRVKGTHPQSFEEIPMALDAMGLEILDKERGEGVWNITFVVS
jgi:tRNA 2-thiouridine synthesizing protein A